MNKEIKEILDKLNNGKWEKDTEEIAYKILFSNEVYQLLDYITNLQEENEMYKNIIDELILTGLASSITKEDFEYMWKVAYNKEYNPNDIKEIAERHGIIKGE